jgi:glycogen operon protein
VREDGVLSFSVDPSRGPCCEFDGQGTGFSVFSGVAERVELCLFGPGGDERRVDLSDTAEGIWHGYVEGFGPGGLYGYRVHGPWAPADGHLCGGNFLLLDPYAKAVHGQVDWHDSLFPYDPKSTEIPTTKADTAPFTPRSVVVDSAFDWLDDRRPGTKLEDTIIYETHVKGFTATHPDIPPEIRGTYAGLAHPAAVKHLTDLGVTAVELMPVQHFVHRRRLIQEGLRNYWGYDPICFFAPYSGYSSDCSPGGAVREFKTLVRALHAAGVEVIVDVVFNHTAEGGAGGSLLAYKGFDNRAYYRLLPGGKLAYADYTGTKNTINAEHPFVRKMIVDSLVYWVERMHVDGFRFDLATVLTREGRGVKFDGALMRAIENEPSLKDAKLIAEPWDLGRDGYQAGGFTKRWSEWNDRYRDDVRDYWNGRGGAAGRFMTRFAGSPDIYKDAGRAPQAGIAYVTCHDGFTLQDLVTYETKRNEANREGGRDGPEDNHAWNCGAEGPVEDGDINDLRARQRRNFLATLLLSQGVPMILGGDEIGRTQGGNNNAYCQDNETSWLDWGSTQDGLLEFIRRVIAIRRSRIEFRCKEWPGGQSAEPGGCRLSWYSSMGKRIVEDAPPQSPREPLQALLSGLAEFLVMFNPRDAEVDFHLPARCAEDAWNMELNTRPRQLPHHGSVAPVKREIKLHPHSLVLLSRI